MPLKHSRSTVTANNAHPHKDNERSMERFAGRICSNFWVERNGEVVLSEWRVALLEAVAETGSISAAAAFTAFSPKTTEGYRPTSVGKLFDMKIPLRRGRRRFQPF